MGSVLLPQRRGKAAGAGHAPPDVAVLVPAWNEARNIELLLPALREMFQNLGIEAEIIVVDGGSTDGTREAAERGGARVLLQRERGYGGALMAGFAATEAPYVITMDADLSHRPLFIEELWKRRGEAEVLIASRYVPGGRADMSRFRRMLSGILNAVYSRALTVKLRDLSSGFRMYRRDVIAQMPIHARDFDVLEEILIRAYNDGWRIAEIPFHYMPRVSGKTHARLLKFGKAYLKTLFQMRRLRNAPDAADTDYRRTSARRVRLLADLVGRGASVLVTGGGSTPIFEELPQAVVLESSAAKVRWLRRRHPRLVQCESTRLPFADASFQAAVDCGSGEKGATEYAEALRILKPGGRFVLTARNAGVVTALGSAGFSEVKSHDFGRGATLVTARKPQT